MRIEIGVLPAEPDDGAVEITATHHAIEVGYLIYGYDGEVRRLLVVAEYRRLGIATALWREAQRLHRCFPVVYPAPRHSAARGELGDAWARSLEEGSLEH